MVRVRPAVVRVAHSPHAAARRMPSKRKRPARHAAPSGDGDLQEALRQSAAEAREQRALKRSARSLGGASSSAVPSGRDEPEVDDCPICLEPMDNPDRIVKLNPCGHSFHGVCVVQHLRRGDLRCPNCRSTQVPAAPPSPVELAADPGLDDMYDEMERIREIFAWRPGLAMEMEEDDLRRRARAAGRGHRVGRERDGSAERAIRVPGGYASVPLISADTHTHTA